MTGLAISHDEAVKIGRLVGRSASYIQRVLAGADDTPEARRIREMAREALGRAPAARRIRRVEPWEVVR